MGTIIKSVAFYNPFFRTGILKLTSQAGSRCLQHCQASMADIGMLINTTVYTENHLAEPALSSLILNKLRKQARIKNYQDRNPGKTFSFDLHSGSVGVIHAIQIIDGFIQSGQIVNGLIIAGDTKPRSGITLNYNYENDAGAILLSNDSHIRGFNTYKTYTYPEFESSVKSSITWDNGKFRFAISQSRNYLSDCLKCVEISLQRFFVEINSGWDQVDLIVASQSPAGFSSLLMEKLNLDDKIEPINGKREIYSAGIVFSLEKVFTNGKFRAAKNILFLAVSSGITVSLSLYNNQ